MKGVLLISRKYYIGAVMSESRWYMRETIKTEPLALDGLKQHHI